MGDWSFKMERGVVGDWPRDQQGEFEPPAFLEHRFGNETELALERNMLWAYGVPSVAQYPKDGALGKVVLGQSGWGMDIYVPESQLEDARNIIHPENSEIDIEHTEEN